MIQRILPVALLLGAPTLAAAQFEDPSALGDPFGLAEPRPLLANSEGEVLEPAMLRLRDGRILWGAIEEHDEQAVVIRRLDNGGRVTLPWGMVDPTQEEQLKLLYGYIEVDVEEVLVQAHRIPIVDGSELVGLIVNRTDDSLYVKTSTTLLTLDKTRIAGPAILVQVPALDIYTREELYRETLAQYAQVLTPAAGEELATGPAAGDAHLEIAAFCERIFDFVHAREHYLLAVEAEPRLMDDVLERTIERAAQKAAVQEQVDVMAEADTWRARKKFDRALELCAAFREQWPRSPLMEDLFRLEARIQRAQQKALREEVVKKWHYYTARLIGKAVREMDFGSAVSWADGELSEEIALAVAEDLRSLAEGLDEQLVRQYFLERESYKIYKASYGVNSWMLGPDEARAELDTSAQAPSGGSGRGDSRDDAREDIQAKIDRYIQAQQSAQRNESASGSEDDPEAAWGEMSSNAKAQWLRAYYAEHSGDMNVTSVRFSACPTCGGSGVLEVIQTGGAGNRGENASGLRLVACPTCHTVGIIRRVSYR